MIQDRPFHKALIYYIPAITILWSLFLVHLVGPFYLSRIDPEFPYLLNGLSCARLDFSRIGHFDHPGTPFQLLSGLFIRFTYWVAGTGTIVDDVITRPEFYLSWATFYLNLIVAGIILWLGKLVRNNKGSILEIVILQSAFFIGNVLIDLPARYIPDRFLEILVYVFIGLCYQYFYTKNLSHRKFAIYSGIVMGVGFITKFNFLPILIFPFILIPGKKDRFIYILIFVVTAFVMFLPVLKEFSYFKGFITSIITHDGLHGKGSEQVFNMQSFWRNTLLIFRENSSFTIVSVFSLFWMVFLVVKPGLKKNYKKELFFFMANILAIAIAVVMVSKHYKSYYLIPVVSLTAFVLLISVKLSQEMFKTKALNLIFSILLLILIIIPSSIIYSYSKSKINQHSNNDLITNFIQNNISSTDYFFVEPTWFPGPIKENGLVYGVSYVAFSHYYYNEYERFYPNIITWEGEKRPIMYFRMMDADNESILKSGKSIHVLSTPGRDATKLCNYIDSCFNQYNIAYLLDTVYSNNTINEYIICFSHIDTWKTKLNIRFGFEKLIGDKLYSDDERYSLNGNMKRDIKKPANGRYTLEVLPNKQSPEFIFDEALAGDFYELTIKRRRINNEQEGNLLLYYSVPDNLDVQITIGEYISHISSHYELIRLTSDLTAIPENAVLKCCFFNHGDEKEYVDDFTIKQFRKE